MGELLDLPMYQQLRILTEQKYPRQTPATFRVPYYAPAIGAIRRFYRSNNEAQTIDEALTAIANANFLQSRIDNNIAVLRGFRRGRQRRRALVPVAGETYTAELAGLELRFTPNLIALDGETRKYVIYDCPCSSSNTGDGPNNSRPRSLCPGGD
jgi:hypothetical protein